MFKIKKRISRKYIFNDPILIFVSKKNFFFQFLNKNKIIMIHNKLKAKEIIEIGTNISNSNYNDTELHIHKSNFEKTKML